MKEKYTKIQQKKGNEKFLEREWDYLVTKFGKSRTILIEFVSVLCIVLLLAITIMNQTRSSREAIDPELARAMTYEQFQEGDDKVEGTENVTFSAFFLRDINQDGYAEKIKGTSKEIGSEDTLYMELNVNTAGYLKDGMISIDGKNFYVQTAMSKDEQLQDNYISHNTKEIKLNSITNGTQKLLTGKVRSGDYTYDSKKNEAIGDNINNYSRNDNKIILTGTYVGEDGRETTINKEINLTMDWYSWTYAEINAKSQNYQDIQDRIDEKNEIFTIEFNIETKETKKSLILSANYVEGTIPVLNGYNPIRADIINTVDGIGDFIYDEVTKKFTIIRKATVSEDGRIMSSVPNENTYKIKVQYPLEAYRSIGYDTVSINVPVKTYYEGYNNPNSEFKNPYQSNVAEKTLIANYANFPLGGQEGRFFVDIEKSNYRESSKKVVSKRKPTKIYNGESAEETNDTYQVKWTVHAGSKGQSSGVVLKETENNRPQVSDEFIKSDGTHDSMENITTNIGIGFWNAYSFLGRDGWIKVYDDETDNLIATFTQYDWSKYTADHPYYYPIPIKHIRVETSANNSNQYLYVYSIKELNDESITTHYTKEEFDNLDYIQSTVAGYAGETSHTDTNQIKYEAEYATADIKISNNTISTQSTERNEIITIDARYNSSYNEVGWVNGSFLVKLPEEILTAQINDIKIDNQEIFITNYELIKKEGSNFIKINTKNSSNKQQEYQIDIDVNLTPDPRIASKDGNIELYASNEVKCDYQPSSKDIYDVNDNLDVTEKVMKNNTSIHFIAPSSLLTSQTISDYDDKGSMVVSPEIADIKPNYASVNNEQKQAKIGVQVKNNYTSTISETIILGKIPFTGNTYAFSAEELGSTYTTKMTNAGIEIPVELEGKVAVYYSEKETPNKDLSNAENGWKTKEQITNWDAVKTYLINFGETKINRGKEYIFYYTIQIPNGLNYNEVSYSHHGVYFCLDTLDGKYNTQIEPSKMGLRIAEKYNLELTKYQSKTDKLVPRATYSVKEVTDDVVANEARTAVTNAQGQLIINGLYAAKTYEIEEIKTPEEYELNPDKIRYTTSVDENGKLSVEKMQGSTKEEMAVIKKEGEDQKVTVQVEDEVKGKLKIIKQERETGNTIGYVSYQITGAGLPESGRTLSTNAYGEGSLSGLSINEEYTLQEMKATGYYLGNPIKFKIVNQDGNYEIQINEGEVKENNVTEEDHIPTANLTLENEKIPTYDLEITKVGKSTDVNVSMKPDTQTSTNEENRQVLPGAKFRLYKNNKEIGSYVTNAEGKIQINGLYQYVEGKPEEATYTLKEVIAPAGYTKVQDITFKVEEKEGTLQFQENDDGERTYTVEGNTIKLQIEDRPVFKLVKKDAETKEVIANAKFAIYDAEKEEEPVRNSKGEILGTKETIDGKEYYTITTNQKGEITADLKEGTYKAVELQAPEKYQVSNQAYYFAIGSSEQEEGLEVTWGQMTQTNTDDVCVVKTSDGGYVTNNLTKITKYSSENEIQWQKQLSDSTIGSYPSQGKTIAELKSGAYVTFYSQSDEERNPISKIVKLNLNGEVEKEERIEGLAYSITSSEDGGLAIIANTKIIKYDENIEKQWEKTITNNMTEAQINQTKDGGFTIGIYHAEYEKVEVDLGDGCIIQASRGSILAKYTKEGTVEWGKFIPGDMTYIESLIETSDGSILVGGYSQEESLDLGDGVVLNKIADRYQTRYGIIIKYNNKGEVQWADKTGSRDMAEINTMIETNDGGYLVGGYTNNNLVLSNGRVLGKIDNGFGGILIKYDVAGNIQWGKTTTNQGSCQIKSIIEMDNGEYVVGGYYFNNTDNGRFDLGSGRILTSNQGSKNVIMLRYKITEQQQVATFREAESIGGTGKDSIQSIAKTQDGGYITVGYFGEDVVLKNGQTLTNHGDLDGMIIKYNEKDEIQWAKSIGGAGKDYMMSVVETEDKGYIIGGCIGTGTIELENGETLNLTWNVRYFNKI